jgi:hypothetical protein
MRRIPFCLALALTLLLPPAAQAAFPGANGEIAFSRVTNNTVETIWAKTPGGAERQVTQTGPTERSPAYSPDGSRIAYVSHQNGSGDVYVRNTDGTGDPINLTTENDATDDLDPSWSPDGKKLVFRSTRSSVVGLYIVDVAVPGSAQRINGTRDVPLDPAWSPVGDQIAYHSSDGDNVDIWLIDANGTNSRNLTDDPMGRTNRDPSWSPDGARIAFSRVEIGTHIWTVDVATGTDEVQLTKEGTLNNRPAYSPDGKRVAWSRGGELWTMPADAHRDTEQVKEALNVRNNAGVDWQPLPKGAEPDPTDTATPTPEPDKGGTGGNPPGGVIGGALGALWEGGGPPAATCAKSSVRFGDVEAIAACFSTKGKANVATGRVRVNGLDLVPSAGAEIEIDPAARTIKSARTVRVHAGSVPLYAGRLDWDLSRGRFEIPLDGSLLKLIRIQGTATVTTDGLGRFRIAALPRIDTIFERFAAGLGAASRANLRLPAITGDLVLRTENGRGLSLESLSLTAESIPLGMLEVRALTLDFDPAAGNWNGAAKLKIPGPPPQVIADATVVVRDGVFDRASLVAGNSLGTYGFGVRLERLALDVRTDPFRFGGELALGAGPSLPKLGQLVRLAGTVDFTAGTPSELRLRGRSRIGPATGTASYTTSSTGRQTFDGTAAVDLRPDIGVSAGVKGVIQQSWFVVQGAARARVLNVSLQGDGLFSNVGLAACVPVKPPTKSTAAFRVGFGFRFADERLDLMAGSCDVAPWSPIPLGGKAGSSARAAQGAPVTAFDLRDALPGMVLAIEGASAPPSVTVTGPGGMRATTPAGGGESGGVLFLRDEATNTTYVAVAAPRAGRWTLTLEPGSSPVAAVRRGDGLPAPRVKARVTGKGHRRTLHWTIRAIPGQVVRFAEEGRGAAAAIATSRKARGSARFAPADGPAGRRSIVAVVEQAGMARQRITAGRYTAPAPQRPAKPKRLALRRRGSTLQVRWKRAAGARSYRIRAELSDGRRLLLTTRRTTLRLLAFGPRETAKVSVAGLREPYSGPAATKRIRRARR